MSPSSVYLLVKQKLAHYCSYQERNKKEVLNKIASFKELKPVEVEKMLEELTEERFLDEQRYAAAFVQEKFHLHKWGKKKIYYSLMAAGIDDKQIHHALLQISIEDYKQALAALASKKQASLGINIDRIQNQKVISYLLQKGYELEIIQETIQ